MRTMKKLRLWHALIAIVAVAAYLSEDLRPVHQWLGYGVVALIVIRLLMALFGAGALGLQRFYPHFHDMRLGTLATHPAISRVLLLGIGLSLLGVTATGVMMDQGRTLQAAMVGNSGASQAQGPDREHDTQNARRSFEDDDHEEEHDKRGEFLEEIHELFANLLIAIVGLHVSYLVVFKWPLARFMLFLRQPRRPSISEPKQ